MLNSWKMLGGELQRQQRLWGRSLFPEELASGFVATSGLRPMLFQVSESRTSVARSELEEVFLGRDEAGSSGQLLGAAGQRGAEPGAARPQQSGRREEGSREAAPGAQELAGGLVNTELAVAPAAPPLPAGPL